MPVRFAGPIARGGKSPGVTNLGVKVTAGYHSRLTTGYRETCSEKRKIIEVGFGIYHSVDSRTNAQPMRQAMPNYSLWHKTWKTTLNRKKYKSGSTTEVIRQLIFFSRVSRRSCLLINIYIPTCSFVVMCVCLNSKTFMWNPIHGCFWE